MKETLNVISNVNQNDTGLYIGDSMIKYNDTLEITDIPKAIKIYKPEQSPLAKTKIDKIIVKLDKHGIDFNPICKFYYVTNEKDNHLLIRIEAMYAELDDKQKTKYKSVKDYERAYMLDKIHQCAIILNETLDSFTSIIKEEVIHHYDPVLEEEIETHSEPYIDFIPVKILSAYLDKGLVQFLEE